MPGVLLIESMAQASGWLIIGAHGFDKMPFLAAVKEAKLRTFVAPGQALDGVGEDRARGLGLRDDARPSVAVDGKTVCNADITFRVVDFPKGEFLDNMHEVAKRIAFPLEAVAHG